MWAKRNKRLSMSIMSTCEIAVIGGGWGAGICNAVQWRGPRKKNSENNLQNSVVVSG